MALLDNSAIEIMASGLGYPEGPVHCSDGSILLVELENEQLTLVSAGGGKGQKVAAIPGSPNGLAAGPGGDLYICNSGGFSWAHLPLPWPAAAAPKDPAPTTQLLSIGGLAPPGYKTGSLQRLNAATGKIEDLYTDCTEHGTFGNGAQAGKWDKPFPLCGPDDLVVDEVGGIWFTDYGKQRRDSKDVTGIYYASADGKGITQMAYPLNSPNGIALSPDGKRLYVALTYERRIIYYDVPEPGQLAMNIFNVTDGSKMLTDALPGQSMPDSIAVDVDENVYVATMLPDGSNPQSNGGISVISQDGNVDFIPIKLPDGKYAPMPSNICFGGKDMKTAYVTCGASGYLIRMPARIAGLKLHCDGSHFDASKITKAI